MQKHKHISNPPTFSMFTSESNNIVICMTHLFLVLRLNMIVFRAMNFSGGNALPEIMLKGCSTLQKLSIINCSLTKIPSLMLSNASATLSYLDLSKNMFVEIKNGNFQVSTNDHFFNPAIFISSPNQACYSVFVHHNPLYCFLSFLCGLGSLLVLYLLRLPLQVASPSSGASGCGC